MTYLLSLKLSINPKMQNMVDHIYGISAEGNCPGILLFSLTQTEMSSHLLVFIAEY